MENNRRKVSGPTKPPHRRHPEATSRCKKHPKHRQSPGVCSICLTERLSRLSAARRARTDVAASSDNSYSSSTSSLSSLYSSYASSSCSSPVPFSAPFSFLRSSVRKSNIIGVTKSRSVASGTAEGKKKKKKTKKRGGLWSKLLGQWRSDDNDTKERREGYRDVLMHPRTARDNDIALATPRIRR